MNVVKETLVLDISVRVVDTLYVGRRYDVGAQHKGSHSYDRCTHQIRTQKAPEAHAGRKHSDYLAVLRKLRRKEDYRDECEQRRELVGEIRQEVEEVVEYGGVERCLDE